MQKKSLKTIPEGWKKERRYQRAGCDLPAYYLLNKSWKPARAITISAGGAFLACLPKKIQKEQIIQIQLLINDRIITALSRVVWINPQKMKNRSGYPYPPGFAVEFEQISGEDRAELDHLVKKTLRMLRALNFELNRTPQDREKIKNLFSQLRPGESLHLNHIKKVVRLESRHFRVRKTDDLC